MRDLGHFPDSALNSSVSTDSLGRRGCVSLASSGAAVPCLRGSVRQFGNDAQSDRLSGGLSFEAPSVRRLVYIRKCSFNSDIRIVFGALFGAPDKCPGPVCQEGRANLSPAPEFRCGIPASGEDVAPARMGRLIRRQGTARFVVGKE